MEFLNTKNIISLGLLEDGIYPNKSTLSIIYLYYRNDGNLYMYRTSDEIEVNLSLLSSYDNELLYCISDVDNINDLNIIDFNSINIVSDTSTIHYEYPRKKENYIYLLIPAVNLIQSIFINNIICTELFSMSGVYKHKEFDYYIYKSNTKIELEPISNIIINLTHISNKYRTFNYFKEGIRDKEYFDLNVIRVSKNEIDSIPIIDKQVILEYDTNTIYVDNVNSRTIYCIQADDDDLENTIINGVSVIREKTVKTYTPKTYSGMGRVILRKNMVGVVNVLTQSMINQANTIYEIRYDFDLNGETITIPKNSILKFEGGSLSNGTIHSESTAFIDYNKLSFLRNVMITGTFRRNVSTLYVTRIFDISSYDSITEIINNALAISEDIYIEGSDIPYKASKTNVVTVPSNSKIRGDGKAVIKAQDEHPAWTFLFNIRYANNVEFSNLIIDGNRENTLNSWEANHLIYILSSTNIKIHGCKLSGARGDAIDIAGKERDDLPIGFCEFIEIYDNEFTNCGRNCLTLNSYRRNIEIHNNKFYGYTYAQYLDCEPTYKDVDSGLMNNLVISNNLFDGRGQNHYPAILTLDSGIMPKEYNPDGYKFVDRVKVTNNIIYNGAIHFNFASYVECTGNTIINDSPSPVYADSVLYAVGYAEMYSIKDNYVYDNVNKVRFSWNRFYPDNRIENLVMSKNFIHCNKMEFFDVGNFIMSENVISVNDSISILKQNVNRPVYIRVINNKLDIGNRLEIVGQTNVIEDLVLENAVVKDNIINVNKESLMTNIKYAEYDNFGYYSADVNKSTSKYNNFPTKGTSNELPTLKSWDAGFEFFDTDLKSKVIWTGQNWCPVTYTKSAIAYLPNINSAYTGSMHYDTTYHRPLFFNGEKWLYADGVKADTKYSGTFADKPQSIPVGFSYFCTDKQTAEGTTNGIMIYHKGGNVWVDALGRVVV